MSGDPPSPSPFAPLPTMDAGADLGLRRFLHGARARVTRLDWNGRPVWLKRPETPGSLRWRLQKGNPQTAFHREITGLRAVLGMGIPAPRILDAGHDFVFLEDAGRSLSALLADPAVPTQEQRRAVAGAAEVLASLHTRGLAHGRPYLRDICWDGQRIRLIDFERFRTGNRPVWHGFDQVLFLASLLTRPAGAAQFDQALEIFRTKAPAPALRAAGRWIRLARLFSPTARFVLRRRPDNREVRGYVDLIRRWQDP